MTHETHLCAKLQSKISREKNNVEEKANLQENHRKKRDKKKRR